MATRLLQVLQFADVGIGATVSLPHQINVNGTPMTPDYVAADATGFEVDANAAEVTVTNNNAVVADVNVWVELKHSIPRQLGAAQTTSLAVRPFVAAAGGGGAGAQSSSYAMMGALDVSGFAPTQAGPAIFPWVPAGAVAPLAGAGLLLTVQPGSVVGISWATADGAVGSTGSLKVQVQIGSEGLSTLFGTVDEAHPNGAVHQNANIDTYVAADVLGIFVTASADFDPTGWGTFMFWVTVIEPQ